jgi:hypothetical protein
MSNVSIESPPTVHRLRIVASSSIGSNLVDQQKLANRWQWCGLLSLTAELGCDLLPLVNNTTDAYVRSSGCTTLEPRVNSDRRYHINIDVRLESCMRKTGIFLNRSTTFEMLVGFGLQL